MNFLDLIIIGGFLLGGLTGYRKGLINSMIGTVATLISLATAFAGYKVLIPIFNTQFKIEVLVRSMLKNTLTRQTSNIQPIGNAPVVDGLPQGLNSEFNRILMNLLHSVAGSTGKIIGDTIVQYISLLIVSMLSYLTIFILTFIVLRYISKILTKGINTSFIGALNSSGGFIAGALAAFMLIGITTCFIVPLFALYSPSLRHLANESLLTPIFVNTFVTMNSMFDI